MRPRSVSAFTRLCSTRPSGMGFDFPRRLKSFTQHNAPVRRGADRHDPGRSRSCGKQRMQRRHPEVSGRRSIFRDGSLGRFGWRGNATNLVRFVDRACANELSLETKRRTQGADPARPNYRNPSIDITDDQIQMMTHFIAALPRPVQQMPTNPDQFREVGRGQEAFGAVGCASAMSPR